MDAPPWLLGTLFGAIVSLSSVALKSTLDRQSYCSNKLFEGRLEALNKIWQALVLTAGIFARKITKGHKTWLEEDREEALKSLDDFKNTVNFNGIMLDAQVVSALLSLDSFWYETLLGDDQSPAEYVSCLNNHMNKLNNAINKTLNMRYHAIHLQLGDMPSP